MVERKLRPGRAQSIRLYTSTIAQNEQITPLDLQDMQSYRDYLYETTTQEAAIKRAKNRRRLEDLQRESGEELLALTESELRDEAALISTEKEDYMPDSVFESVVNSLSKEQEEFVPTEIPAYGSKTMTGGNIISSWIAEKIINFVRGISNSEKNADIIKEQRQKHLEFDNYTEKAQKDAFERYKVNHNITDKDVQQNGKPVIKQNVSDKSEQIYNALTSPEGKLSAKLSKLGDTIYDPDRNENTRFGTSEYFNDASTRFLINLNEAQKGAFQGRIDRTAEVVALGEDAVKYYANLNKIETLNTNLLELYLYVRNTGGTVSAITEKLINDIKSQIQEIETENKKLYESTEKFKLYVPDDFIDNISVGFFKALSDAENAIFGTSLYGWTSPLFDDADVLREKLVGFNTSDNWTTKSAILDRYKEARNKKVELWQKGILMNDEDISRHELDHKISDYYNYWEQHASGKILDGDTWAFKQPGLFGYSNSGWIKLLPMYVGGIASGWMGPAAASVAAGVSAVGGHSAALDENYMELRENYIPVVEREIKALGKDVWDSFISGGFNSLDEKTIAEKSDEEIDKEIINNFLDGIYKPTSNVQKIYEASANATHGLNALFDRDMMATDLDNIVNTAIMFGTKIPAGKLLKFVEPAGKMGSPLLGISASALKASPVGKALAKAIDDITTFMASIPRKIYVFAKNKAPKVIKTPRTRKFVRGVEDAVTLANKPATKLALSTTYDNAKQYGKAIAYSSLSEGIEEGKQYLHGHAFQRGELSDETVSFGLDANSSLLTFWNNPDWAKWYDDMIADIKSAYVIAGMPFGLEYTHDPELVENIKGGMMGGLFQTGYARAIPQTKEYLSQMKLNKYLLNNVMTEKAVRTDLYEKAKLYAQKSLSPQDTQYVLSRFDSLIKYNDDVTDESKRINKLLLEEQKELFKSVHQVANSQEVIERAKKLGINRGDEKYNQFVAQLALQGKILNESSVNLDAIQKKIIETEERTEPIYSYDEKTGKIMRKTGTMLLPWIGELEKHEDGTEETKQEAADRLNMTHSMQNGLAVKIKAAQDLLALLEIADDHRQLYGNAKWSSEFLKSRLKSYIQKGLDFIAEDKKSAFLKNLDSIVNSTNNSDVLLDLYRKLALAQVDLDYASMMYQSLMGKNSIHEKQVERVVSPNGVQLDFLYDDDNNLTTFDNIIKAYENRVKGDTALYDALEEDYSTRYHLIEKQVEDERRAMYLQMHPELKALEKMRARKEEPKSHISAIDKSTKTQVSFEKAKTIGEAVKNLKKNSVSKKDLRKILKDAGIRVADKYENVLLDIAKRYKKGDLTDKQFALMFVPKEERLQFKDQPEEKKQLPIVQEKPKKETELKEISKKLEIPVEKPKQEERPVEKTSKKEKPIEKKPEVTAEDTKIKNLVDKENIEDMNSLIKEFKSLYEQLNTENYGEESPESKMFRVVTQMAFLVLKKNPMSFEQFADQMIDLLGDPIKPYLKVAYNGVRDFPGSESFADKLTSRDIVDRIHDKLIGKRPKSDDLKKLRTEQVESLIEMVNETVSNLNSISQAPELSLDAVLDAAKLFYDTANTYLNSDLDFASQGQESLYEVLNQMYKNVGTLFNIAEKEHILAQNSNQDKGKKTVSSLADPETWMSMAVQAFSFYSSKIAADLPLTDEDIKNLNQWIVCSKDPNVGNSANTSQKTEQLYKKIVDYISLFNEIGLDGSNTVPRKAVSISSDANKINSQDYNTLQAGALAECKAVNDKTLRLFDVTSEEDFLDCCTVKFVLGGTDTFEGPVKEGYPEKIYAIFTYKGIEFEPCKVYDTNSTKVSEENAQFGSTVRKLIQENPNAEVVPIEMSRTKGILNEQPEGQQVLLTEAGLVDDVYAISFDNDQEEFMLTRAVPTADGGLLVRATKPNKTGKGVADIYTYGEKSNAARAGNVVYLKKTKGSNKPYFPVNLYTPLMEEGEAQLIVDILTGKYTNGIIGKQAMSTPFILEGEYLGTSDGVTTLGLTARDVLNMILPYEAFGRKGSDLMHIWHSLYNESIVFISGKYEGEDEVKNHEYNLSTVQGKEKLKEDLMKYVRVNISETVMRQSLGKFVKNGNNPLSGLSQFIRSREGKALRERLKNGEKIKLGNSKIIFDWNDLSDSKRKDGITGIGWYVKRGFLTTKFAGLKGSLINFTGAKLKSEPDSITEKKKTPDVNFANVGTNEKPNVPLEKPNTLDKKPTRTRKSIGNIRDKASMEKVSSELSEETRTIDEVRSLLSEIIPVDSITVEISDDYLDDKLLKRVVAVSECAPHVVGRAYADAVILYKHARLLVAYHEAFHRIAEIFLDDAERNKVYNWYKSVWKRHNDGEPTLKQLQEGTADQFMFFMEHDMIFDWNKNNSLTENIKGLFKSLSNTVKFFNKIGSFGLYKMYYSIGRGKFKNFKMDDAAKKRAENFAKEHPEGYGYELDGVTLEYILNEHDFRDMVNSLVYFVFHANDIDFGGDNIRELQVSKEVVVNSKFYKEYAEQVDEEGNTTYAAEALKEAIEHWDVFVPYVVSAISEFATDYTTKVENDIESDNDDIQSASISEHTSQSYEFSQFSRASSRVKFFFSRIDSTTLIEHEGKVERADKVNALGLPEFIDAKSVFNDVLNQLWDIDDLSELMSRLQILSKDSPVYEQIVNRMEKLKELAYANEYNADKESLLVLIFNVIKSNKQQFYLAQANRVYDGRDVIGYSVNIQNTDMEYNARNYRRDWSDLFAHGGSIFVEVGEDGLLTPKKGMAADSMAKYWGLITNLDSSRGKKLGIAAAFSSDSNLRLQFTMNVKVNGQTVLKKIDAQNNEQDLQLCKTKFIQILNCFAIQFDKQMLDYMLRQKYGNSGFDGMQQLFQDTGTSSLFSVQDFFNATYFIEKDNTKKLSLSQEGRLNGRRPDRIFDTEDALNRKNGDSESNGFFGELAKYKYLYRHAHDQLSVLAAQGNKFYVISENNYITDTVAFLNRAIRFYKNNDSRMASGIEEFDELQGWSYNLIEDDDDGVIRIGSVIIKLILEGLTDGSIEICTLSGMKSDRSGDAGVDYTTMSTRDDYVSKMSILLSGGIIFPTMSDKKTWVFLKGFTLPGINWNGGVQFEELMSVVAHDLVSGKSVIDNKGRITSTDPFSYAIENSNDVVDQLIEYFITEHQAVKECIELYKSMPEERRVSNYHSGKKVKDKHGISHTIIQGARHSSLLNLYDDNDELIPISRVLDEQGEYIDEEKEFEMVDDLFFRVREEEGETEQDLIRRQRRMVNKVLKHRLEEELAKIESLGLIKKVGTGNTIFDYENVGIDSKKVNTVYDALLTKYQLKEKPRVISVNGNSVIQNDLSDEDKQRFKSLALSIVVNDVMVKSIMSKNETERIFSGHPSFFKWGYDDEGNLVDRGVDQHKRYGGLVSTGQNNALWAKGIRKTYRSTEIDNEMVLSQQIDFLRKNIYEGSLRKTLIDAILDIRNLSIDDDLAKPIVEEIDKLSIDDVKKQLKETSASFGTDLLELAESEAKGKINDFRLSKEENLDGIDVADGASYVTDTFFEQMLRSVGEWGTDVQTAFKILRGEEVNGKKYTLDDVTSIAQAYELVLTKVIGTQKYTAYGQRKQTGWNTEEGYQEATTMIPYYDKFALFPLFKIMCTGKMAHIYKAMLDQNVDMLKIKSAIKVGMEGSQPLNWDNWTDDSGEVIDSFHDPEKGFKFNIYEQRMKYLRKQFNTDPKEKEYLTMGTQMTKVVMQALTAGRYYIDQDGKRFSAKQLRDDVMNCMVLLAKIGDLEFRKEFFKEDGSINLQAFSKMIKDELIRRGAGKDIIDGFTIVRKTVANTDGSLKTVEEFKISPSAQSDLNWIQSIIASAVNKRIIDINTPGNLFIQRSVWGMEGKTKIRGDQNLPSDINNGNKLKLINEEGSMDCVLSIDFFEHILPKKVRRDEKGNIVYKTDKNGDYVYQRDKNGDLIFDEYGNPKPQVDYMPMSFKESKQWLIDNDIISGVKTGETEWHNAKSSIVGYRIPTQAVSSIHAFRCVDVLPVVRDTVIMPEEITKVTGSDYDIDKMFLSTVNYNVKNKVASDVFEEGTAEYYQNKLIRDQIAMLLNKDENGVPRNIQLLHGAIDKDTKLLKDVLKELESKGNQKERLTYQDYVLSNEVYIKRDFITGKNGIGPFALNNNNHILTMLYGVRFAEKKGSILTRLNLTRLDRSVDRDGKSILSWLSGLINAHVDIAKDPYIGRLGVNPFTYNMTNLLIRTGLGKTTFYFLTQPIIMQLAEVYSNATGVYTVDRTKSVSQLRRESRQEYIIDYINKNLGTEFTLYDYNDAISAWKKTMEDRGININSAIDSLFHKKNSLMRDVSSKYKSTGDKPGALDKDSQLLIEIFDRGRANKHFISMFDMQMLTYTAFEQFEPYAQALSNVVKYSKIDTKKQGKTITEQRAYKEGVYNTFLNPRGTARMFNSKLRKMYKESFIKEKTDLALQAFDDILAPLMLQATNLFNRQLRVILSVLNKEGDSLTEDIISDVTDAMLQLIKSRFINEYAKRHNINIKGLVSGDNTMYDRLVKLSTDIRTKDEYQDMLMDGEINNYLLKSFVTALEQTILQPDGMQKDTYPNAKFIKLLNFLEDDQMDSDQLRSDWRDLLEDGTHPEIQEFVRDLIVYSFITTGDTGGGLKNLFKFVPNSWKLSNDEGYESYDSYMRRVLSEYNEGKAPDIDIDDLILNNWREYNFVPSYTIGKKGGYRFQTYFSGDMDYPILLSGITGYDDNPKIQPTFNEDPEDDRYYPSPRYLKVARKKGDTDEYSQRSFSIYKRIAFGQYVDEFGNTQSFPIYVLVGPKGNVFMNGYRILEYGRNDQTYTQTINAILKDPIIKEFLKDTKSSVTDVENLILEILQAYDNVEEGSSEFNETLKFIASGYVKNNRFQNEGGTIIRQKYNRNSVEQDPENLYIFTDNTDRSSGSNVVDMGSRYALLYSDGNPLFYPNSTTAQIRGLDNAYPISTQHWYHDDKKGKAGQWTDEDYDEVVKTIEFELSIIQEAWLSGVYKNIVLPIGNGFVDSKISEITKERTPKLYEYFVNVDQRIQDMVEKGIPLVKEEDSTFKPGQHPGKTLLNLALTDTRGLLDHVSKNSTIPAYRILAEKLLNYAEKNNVQIFYVNEGDKFIAHYKPTEDIIEMNVDNPKLKHKQEEIFLHETLHSLTSRWLLQHPEDQEKIMKLAEYVKSKLTTEVKPHIFDNAREFLTYATTDLSFRSLLKEIEPMDSKEYESIFDQLLDNIKQIIYKIMGNPDQNVIQQIDPIIDKILDLQKDLNESDNYDTTEEYEPATDEHGNLYGWSVESIRTHLKAYVEDSVGYSVKHRKAHVKLVNLLYGTNFGVYLKGGKLHLKDNTNPAYLLRLTENPNSPKQLNIFDDFKEDLKSLGEQLMRECGY